MFAVYTSRETRGSKRVWATGAFLHAVLPVKSIDHTAASECDTIVTLRVIGDTTSPSSERHLHRDILGSTSVAYANWQCTARLTSVL